MISVGRLKEGIEALETSLRLDPLRSAIRLNQIASASYFSGECEVAIETANHAIRSYPDYPNPYRWLAAARGQIGPEPRGKGSAREGD